MSDQLSKVVAEMREMVAMAAVAGTNRVGTAVRDWADRIESAAPVEVEEVADDLNALEQLEADVDLVAACTGRVRLHIATLARQLAEAKAENERLKGLNSQLVNKSNTQVIELARLEEALAAATRRVAEVEKEAATERALQRAAKELPEGWDVCVYVEQGSGWVELRNPDLDTVEFDRDDYSLTEQIESAIDKARATGEGEGNA